MKPAGGAALHVVKRQLCGVLWSHIKYVVRRTHKDRSLCGSLAATVVRSCDSCDNYGLLKCQKRRNSGKEKINKVVLNCVDALN